MLVLVLALGEENGTEMRAMLGEDDMYGLEGEDLLGGVRGGVGMLWDVCCVVRCALCVLVFRVK